MLCNVILQVSPALDTKHIKQCDPVITLHTNQRKSDDNKDASSYRDSSNV